MRLPPPLLAVQITDEAEIAALGEDLTHPQTELPAGENIFADGKTEFISLSSGLSNAFDNASLYKPADGWPSRSMCAEGKSYLGLGYTFASPKKIVAYSVSIGQLKWSRGRRAPKTFTLFGTNDDPLAEDATWDNLGTGENNGYEKVTNWIDDKDETATKAPETRYFRCQDGAPLGYKSFKWVATAPVNDSNGYIHVSELEFFGTDVNASDLPALAVSADVPDWVKESKPEAFAARATLDAGSVTIPVPAEFHDEESGTSRYRRVGYAVEAYNPQTSAYDLPVAVTPSADGDSFSFACEAEGRYLLTWLFDREHLVRCAALDGLGTVFVDGAGDDSPAEAWVKEGANVTVSATPNHPETDAFLQWEDAAGKIYKESPLTIPVTGPMELTAQFWKIDQPFVWYVKPAKEGGDDAEDGLSPETAKATIKAALADVPNSVAATIYVFPGVYSQSKPLSLTVPVALVATAGDPSLTSIKNTGSPSFANGTIASHLDHSCLYLNHAEARVENFTIVGGAQIQQGGKGEQVTIATNGGTVSNCVFGTASIEHPHEVGVLVNSTRGLIQNCVFENMKATSGTESDWGDGNGHGIALKLVNGRVENCLFKNNHGASGKFTVPRSVVARLGTGAELVNCTFIENSAQKGICFVESGAKVVNCAFYANVCLDAANVSPIRNSFGGTAKSYQNCASDMTPDAEGAETTYVPATCLAGLTAADFKDYANGNFMPKAGGLLCNKGASVTLASVLDLAGNPRVQGSKIDIGAYEAPPGGLRILIR